MKTTLVFAVLLALFITAPTSAAKDEGIRGLRAPLSGAIANVPPPPMESLPDQWGCER